MIENPGTPESADPHVPLPPVTSGGIENETGETPPEPTDPPVGVDPYTDPPVGVTPITIEYAKTLVKNYQNTAETPVIPVKGVFLDKVQLAAMTKLAADFPGLSGFRIFFGKETTGLKVSVVVGVDKSGKDVFAVNGIYKTTSPGSGPCPPVCDQTSPINTD
jgi:hypothetical protein